MSSSQVDIYNMALAHCGSSAAVQATTEASIEARYCNVFWDTARKATLRSRPWKFATRRVDLADTGSPPTDWQYAYAYPSDCLRAIRIVNDLRAQTAYTEPFYYQESQLRQTIVRYPFEVGNNGTVRVIWSDKELAELEYLADITDPQQFDPEFTMALSWHLAALIAPAITGSDDKAQKLWGGYRDALDMASASNGSEAEPDLPPLSEFITARA